MKYLLLSFIIFLSSCSCSYHLSKLKEKGCMKDSVRIDTVFSEKKINIELPKDTIIETINLITEKGIFVNISDKYFHKGILHAKINVKEGVLSVFLWNDSIYQEVIKDTVIIKEKAKTITIKPTTKELIKQNIFPILIYSLVIVLLSLLLFLKIKH